MQITTTQPIPTPSTTAAFTPPQNPATPPGIPIPYPTTTETDFEVLRAVKPAGVVLSGASTIGSSIAGATGNLATQNVDAGFQVLRGAISTPFGAIGMTGAS